MVSRRLRAERRTKQAARDGDDDRSSYARTALYRGQCNCSYWHGAFGGIYLPHLRNAVYNHLIAADNLLDAGHRASTARLGRGDGRRLQLRRPPGSAPGQRQAAVPASPRAAAGSCTSSTCARSATTCWPRSPRRPEAYHRKVLAAADGGNGERRQHSRPRRLQAGRARPAAAVRSAGPQEPARSLLRQRRDPGRPSAAARRPSGATSCRAPTRSRIRQLQRPHAGAALLAARARADWSRDSITKGVTLEAGSPALEIAYLLEDLPPDARCTSRWSSTSPACPAAPTIATSTTGERNRLGQLGTQLDLSATPALDRPGRRVAGHRRGLSFNRPSGSGPLPIETVSQSEGGFELVHQSVSVQPHWLVRPTPTAAGR